MKKVLLISHEASRTGAPILLLNLLTLLKIKGFDVEVLLKQDGNLKRDFEKQAKATILYPHARTLLQKIRRKIHYILVRRRLIRNAANYDIIISNTILNADL